MKLVVVVLLLAALALASARPFTEEEYQSLFGKFIDQHNKKYGNHYEFFKRFNAFKNNMDFITKHQSNPDRKFQLSMNQFGDLTNAEFRARYNGFRRTPHPVKVVAFNTSNIPSSVDWPSKGVVTGVKDQGQCGSCWSFSTTGSVEAVHAISTGQLVSLSEQQLVDCSTSYGNQGCNGGLMDQAFQYIIANGGLCTEDAYPYEAQDDQCRSDQCQSAVTISGYQDVSPNSEDQLAAAVAQHPVSVAVDAAGENWQFYSGGVMDSSCGTDLDHGVLAAGYGEESGEQYWLVKNSWGTGWGESGYIKLLRNGGSGGPGQCGITLSASYPVA